MMQFARRHRWLLPVTLLITAVTVQLAMPADGSERQEQRTAGTQVEVPEYDVSEEEAEGPLEVLEETQLQEPLTSRTKKRSWRQNYRRRAALVPLVLAAVAATYLTAGYVMQRLQRKKTVAETLVQGAHEEDLEMKAPAGPVLEEEAPAPKPDTSRRGLATLLKLGRAVLEPAAVVAVAAAAVTVGLKYAGIYDPRVVVLPWRPNNGSV